MQQPPLVHYHSPEDYREHYLQNYCRSQIHTHDGIRVFFAADKFGHAFYESASRDGKKDEFSPVRAQRIDWIKHTLEHPDADHFQGWDSKRKVHVPHRRVSVVYGDYVVVIQLIKFDANGRPITSKFTTAYLADNSIGKIRSSPIWTLE